MQAWCPSLHAPSPQPGCDLFTRNASGWLAAVFPSKPKFMGNWSSDSNIRCMFHGPGVPGRRIGACVWPSTTTYHGSHTRRANALFNLLRADKSECVNRYRYSQIEPSPCQNFPCPGQWLYRRPAERLGYPLYPTLELVHLWWRHRLLRCPQ